MKEKVIVPVLGKVCPYSWQLCKLLADGDCPMRKAIKLNWEEYLRIALEMKKCQYQGRTLTKSEYMHRQTITKSKG